MKVGPILLSTARLDLEPLQAQHTLSLAEALSDPELYRYLPSEPLTVDEWRERLRRWADGRSPVVRRTERRRLDLHLGSATDKAVHELLTPDLDRALEVVWVEAEPGYTSKDTPFVHAGEEVGVVIEGRHEVYLDGVCHVLEAGDAIAYSSTIPHWYTNPGPDRVTAIWIITPPSF